MPRRIGIDNYDQYSDFDEYEENHIEPTNSEIDEALNEFNLTNRETRENNMDTDSIIDSENQDFEMYAELGDLNELKKLFELVDYDTKVRALFISVANNKLNITNFLIQNDIDINSIQNNSHLIEYTNEYDTFKYLIENGAIITDNIFYDKCIEGESSMVKYLLLTSTFSQDTINRALLYSAFNSQLKIIKLLLNNHVKANINIVIENENILSGIIKHDYDLKILEYLVQKKVDIHLQNDRILIDSVKNNWFNITKYLLKNGADIHTQNDIVFNTNNEFMKKLLKSFGEPNKKLFDNINSKCNSDNITDKQIQEISKILNLQDSNKKNICEKISHLFKVQNEYMSNNIDKCKTETTLLGTDIKDIPSLYFYIIHENENLFCGDIREFIKLKINPWTNLKISDSQLDKIHNDFNILNVLFTTITDQEEFVQASVVSTIRKVITSLLSQLRYPKTAELFVNSTENTIDNFITELTFTRVLSSNDTNQINKITNIDNKKITLCNILILKLKNETNTYSSIKEDIEEIYNKIFN